MSIEEVVYDRDELSEQELAQHGFTSVPFVQTEYTVSLPSWQTQFQLMQHMLLYSNAVLSMTSDENTGKTTFIDELVNFLPESFLCHRLEATSYLNPTMLRQQLIQWFSFNSIGDFNDDEIAYFIGQLSERQQHCLIIIDDAERLSQGCLDMLFEYAAKQDENAFFHVFLVGTEPLSLHLEPVLETYPDDLNYAFELPLMSRDETLLYLKDSLRQAGFHEDFPLSQTVVEAIYTQADGKFDELDNLAYEALLQALRQPKTAFPTLELKEYRWPAMMFLALVIAVVGMKPLLYKDSEHVRRLALPEKKLPSATLVSQDDDFRFDTPDSSANVSTDIQPETPPPVTISAFKSKPVKTVIKTKRPRKVALKKHRKPLRKNSKKVAAQASSPSLETQMKAIRASRNSISQGRIVVLDSLVHMPKPVKFAAQSQKNHYGIQLLASSNLGDVKNFIKQHRVKDARVIKKTLGKKTWYSLVVGGYETRHQAKTAIKHLPKDLRQLRPWVSSYSLGTVISHIA